MPLKQIDPGGYWFLWGTPGRLGSDCRGQLYGKPAPRYVPIPLLRRPETKVIAQSRHELDMCDLTAESLQAALGNPGFRSYRTDYPWIVNIDPVSPDLP